MRNTVIVSPHSIIVVLEGNYQGDRSIKIPKVLRPYMDGIEVIKPNENN